MILAVPLRTVVRSPENPQSMLYYLSDHYKHVFNELGINLFSAFPVYTKESAREIEAVCDGLILSGSEKNIYPEYYGQERMPEMAHTYTIDEYACDRLLLEAFVEAGKPVLGIYGGMQSINVYFGGTLNQHVHEHIGIAEGHTLHLEKDSFLYDTYGCDTISGNSYHVQCADVPAPGFRVTARADDGTIEAIEKDNILGVQWHPETARDMKFFHAYVKRYLK